MCFKNFVSGKISSEQKNDHRLIDKLSNYVYIIAFLLFLVLTVVLPFFFLAQQPKHPTLGIVFLFVGFCMLTFFALGSSAERFFPLVLFYAFFTKLPIRPNHSPSIRSVPPTDYIIQHKPRDISHVNMSYSAGNSEVESQPSTEEDDKKKKEKQRCYKIRNF